MGLMKNLIFSEMVRKPSMQLPSLASACMPVSECMCFAF